MNQKSVIGGKSHVPTIMVMQRSLPNYQPNDPFQELVFLFSKVQDPRINESDNN